MRAFRVLIVAMALAVPASAYADATLLVGQPFGHYGHFNPAGHTAIYLSRVCADSPTLLRRCEPGETGIVLNRYGRLAGFDWIAIPLMPYLYGVERGDQVPASADKATVMSIRDTYRREHLTRIFPNSPTGEPPPGDWREMVGAAYDRRFYAFSVATTPEQDDALIAKLNADANRRRFNLLFRNCANFTKDIFNTYFPGAIHASFIADLGLTTPKDVAKSLVRYAERHPALELQTFEIEQIPGFRSASHNNRGVLELFVTSKRYLVPLTIIEPWIPVSLAAGYLATGRFNPDSMGAITLSPSEVKARFTQGPF